MNAHGGTEATLGRAEGMVREHMSKYDPSHDWAHVKRVRNTALRIAKDLDTGPDLVVVELTALFHDMAAKYGPTSSLTSILTPFFTHPSTQESLLYSQKELILQIIPCVSWTAESRLRSKGQWTEWHESCVELHAVQDADRLDAIGAVGIMRVSAYSGAKGRVLIEDGSGPSAEGHFDEKLLKIRDRMKTAWGKKEAELRHQTMLDFLSALKREKSL